ncbi:MAG TPA: Asp23/Gls24 family envelope stress response protein [Firmicutes bacterium]|nr:Asp23/Gls24 family envelope stress response protein [Bacillota bacterium]
MQNREFNRPDPAGTLSISEDVIATIAANTTTEIEGVAALANFYSNVVSSWFWKKQSSRPIIINLNDDVATIDIHVSLRSGVRIPDVAQNIQRSVKDAVQNMTGIAVTKVNVYVSGIVFDTPSAPVAAES